MAELGLRVTDDLSAEGAEHPEGALIGSQGIRAEGTDWKPVQSGGVIAHALRAVFEPAGPSHPFACFGKYQFGWRPWEVEARPDGLKIPGLEDVGAAGARPPAPRVLPQRPQISDFMRPAATADGFRRSG